MQSTMHRLSCNLASTAGTVPFPLIPGVTALALCPPTQAPTPIKAASAKLVPARPAVSSSTQAHDKREPPMSGTLMELLVIAAVYYANGSFGTQSAVLALTMTVAIVCIANVNAQPAPKWTC